MKQAIAKLLHLEQLKDVKGTGYTSIISTQTERTHKYVDDGSNVSGSQHLEQTFRSDIVRKTSKSSDDMEKLQFAYLEEEPKRLRNHIKEMIQMNSDEVEKLRAENDGIQEENENLVNRCEFLEKELAKVRQALQKEIKRQSEHGKITQLKVVADEEFVSFFDFHHSNSPHKNVKTVTCENGSNHGREEEMCMNHFQRHRNNVFASSYFPSTTGYPLMHETQRTQKSLVSQRVYGNILKKELLVRLSCMDYGQKIALQKLQARLKSREEAISMLEKTVKSQQESIANLQTKLDQVQVERDNALQNVKDEIIKAKALQNEITLITTCIKMKNQERLNILPELSKGRQKIKEEYPRAHMASMKNDYTFILAKKVRKLKNFPA